MPTIGGVYVPDDLMPGMGPAPARARPSLATIVGASAEGTWKQMKAALPYQLEVLTRERVDPGLEQRYQRGLEESRAAFARAPAASLDDATSGRVGVGRFIAENIASTLPQMAGIVAGGAAGGLAGGPGGALAGAVAVGTPMFSASNVARSVEENGALDVSAAERSLAAAPVQAAADALLGRFLPGAGKFLGGAAATQSGGFIRRTAASMGKAGLTEAATEAGQQVLERAAAGIPIGNADAAAEYVNAAVTAFAVGGTLGAAGGFRRTDAVAKPVDMVTPEDMAAHIDGVLDGSLRARAPDLEEQLPLGLEGGNAVEQQQSLPLAEVGPAQEALPSELPQLALDPALSSVAPDTQLELGQRFRDNITPVDLPLEGGVTVSPEAEAVLRGEQPLTDADLLLETQGRFALANPYGGGNRVLELPTEQKVALPDNFRAYRDATVDELETLRKNKAATPEAIAEIEREYAARAAEATGAAPLTTENFQTRVDEMKRGLRGGFVQSIEAKDATELADKVYDQVFTEADTRSNTVKFAQRLGILDAEMKPGPLAKEVEARRAAASGGTAATTQDAGGAINPAPPAEPTAIAVPSSPNPADIAAVEAAKAEIGVQRAGNLKNLNTPADVFAQLATDRSEAKRSGESTRVEQLAKKLGLITDDDAMDYTPKGRTVYLQSAQGLETTTSAAADAGYIGAGASQFDRGARAAASGQEQATFADFEEMAAYQAGKTWARDFIQRGDVASAAETRGTIERQDVAKQGVRQAIGAKGIKPSKRKAGVERAPLTPQQVRTQSLNALIDAADLRTVNDTDIVALRRMAREGVEPSVLGKALQDVQGGKTLFRQPEERTPAKFSPMPTRGGQPAYREMRGDRGTVEIAGIAQPKRINRAETDAAVQAFDLRNLIKFALAEKAINQKRADRLNQMLDDGNVKAVQKSLKNFLAEANFAAADSGVADPAFEQWVSGKDFMGALDHMVDHGPSAYHRAIMKQVRELARGLQRQGVTLELKIVKPGDRVPVALLAERSRALTVVTRNPAVATVYLKSIELGGSSGMNYQLAGHEMIHAVTMSILQRGNTKGVYGNTKLGKAVQDLYELQGAIADHFNARIAEGNLNAFEQAFYSRMNNSLADVDEIIAWGLTNPEMQRYLQSIQYAPKQSVFGRLISLLRDLLGLDGKYDTALTELLRVSEQLMGTEAAELQMTFPRNNPELMDEAALEARADDAGVSAANRTVGATNTALTDFAAKASQIVEAITPDDAKIMGRRVAMRWMSHNQLNRLWGKVMPGLLKHTEAHRWRDAVRANFESMGDDVYQAFEKLEREKPQQAKWVGELMATTTEFQVDPDKTWDEHTHILEKDRARVKPMFDAAVKMKNDLSRGDAAGIAVFNQFRAFNEAQNYARLAAGLHNLVAMDPELALGVQDALTNPTEAFLKQQGLVSGVAIRDWWHKTLMQQIASTITFVNAKRGEVAAGTASEQNAMRNHLSPIELQISAIHEALAGMAKAPYFHLGRFGDYFGSAVVRTNTDGTANPEALEKVAAAIEAAGFGDVQISLANNRAKIMMRFDTNDQSQKFKALMKQLHGQGLLEGELGDAVKAGARDRSQSYGAADGFPAFVQNYIERIEASPMYTPSEGMTPDEKAALEKRKEEAVRLAVDTWLESQPDSSISKVLAKRYTVPGYKKDMIRNFAHRWRVGAISLANVASAPKFNEAFVDMRSAAEAAKDGDSEADQPLLNDLLAETKARDATVPLNDNADTFDKARAIAHSYFLGLSPAYAFINMTQMGTVALPELAKKHGYAKSFGAMRRAGGDAIKILRAAFNEAVELGPQNWANVAITETVLTKAGLDPKTAAFAMRMIASGTIDIGSQARSLGQVSENRVGSKLDMGLKYASALGMYSETLSRLTTALAAYDLHGGDLDPAADYATQVVSESMLDYQSWNTARALGKKGILGPVTPIVTQFMSYSVQMTEKLISEFTAAVGRPRTGETAEQTKQRQLEARRFLAGHLTAIVALTGTLGLPFLTVFATALERMVDQFDDDEEPFDVTATYRGWLTDVLGKDMAEVASRGVPRVLGFDLSARAGEQNLLPFSEFFADRRPWKEAIEANVGRSLGAVPSMVSNVITGGGKIADGDVLAGMKEMLPVGFKGPLEAYRMTSDGYVDTQGNKLPMSPAATSMVWQLMGFTPSEKAEYNEVRGELAARKGEITRRAGVLRDQIVLNLLPGGDRAKAVELMAEAQAFDNDNPDVGLVNSIPQALNRRMMNRSRATALQTPLGVSMDDIAGQRMARYANVEYGR